MLKHLHQIRCRFPIRQWKKQNRSARVFFSHDNKSLDLAVLLFKELLSSKVYAYLIGIKYVITFII